VTVHCQLFTVNCLLADIILDEFDGLADAVFGSDFFAQFGSFVLNVGVGGGFDDGVGQIFGCYPVAYYPFWPDP
jgi:hypothetical protein